MSENIRTPSTSATPTGATAVTLVGGATAHAILAATSTASYVTASSSYATAQETRVVLTYSPGTSGLTDRIDWIQPVFTEKYSAIAGWFYPAKVTGYVGSTPHALNLTAAAPGAGYYDVFEQISGPASTKAADGTPWSECDSFTVEYRVNVVVFGQWGGGVFTQWGSSRLAQLAYAALRVVYTAAPTVGSITPTGTVTTPQPTIAWHTNGGTQSAYRVVVVPIDATDGDGVAVGAGGFNPATVASPTWDSGKVASTDQSALMGNSVTDGVTYVAYIMAWIGTGSAEKASSWWTGGSFTADIETVDAPVVELENDATTYAVSVSVGPGTHTADQFPTYFEVQYLDPVDGWVAAPITDSQVPGDETSVFYDGLQAPGATVTYRARGVWERTTDGLLVTSAWVQQALTAANKHEWWLRSTTDYLDNRSLHDSATLLVKDWKTARKAPQAASWGIGARAATVSRDIVKSNVMSMVVWAMTSTARDDLLTLVESGDDLMLITEWGEMFRVQVGDIDEQHVVSAPRPSETTDIGMRRLISFSLIEVVAP